MNEKISWYREVLELEPDSRLFLPLARLLVEEGLMKEAESILDQGVTRHPSFLEARLFRVEVLKALGRNEESSAELDELVLVLSRNRGFWKTWAENEHVLGREGASLAVRLLDLVMSGAVVDMQDIIRRGIESLEMELAGASCAKPLQTNPKPAKPEDAMPEGTVGAPEVSRAADAPDAVSAPITPTDSHDLDASQAPSVSTRAATPLFSAASTAPAKPDKPAEAAVPAKSALSEKDKSHWPPRTRSMAEVLAEQEEYRDAASIYEELIEKCRKGQCDEDPALLVRRRDELLALACGKRPDDLAVEQVDLPEQAQDACEAGRTLAENVPAECSRAKTSPAESAQDVADDVGHGVVRLSPATDEEGLVSILEELARRMEARIG